MSHPRWVHSYRLSVLAGAVGVMLITSKAVAQTTLPGIIESNLVTVVVGIGILWVGWWRIGRLEKDLAEGMGERLRIDRFEDHRAMVADKFEAVLERLEGLHKSIQAIRRAQLVRFEEKPQDEGGV